jgi:hypothetical protein
MEIYTRWSEIKNLTLFTNNLFQILINTNDLNQINKVMYKLNEIFVVMLCFKKNLLKHNITSQGWSTKNLKIFQKVFLAQAS